MNSAKTILMSAALNFRKWRGSWRVGVPILCTITFYVLNLWGLRGFCADYEVNITAWLFPFMYGIGVMIMLFGYSVIVLFSDAPFMDGQMMFWVARTGRLSWILGQIIYIVLASLIYALFLALLPALILMPNVSFANDWGEGMYFLAERTDVLGSYNVALGITSDMLKSMSPSKIMLASTLMAWLCGMFIGSIMLCANMISGAYLGTIFCSLLALLSYFSIYVGPYMIGDIIYWISPLNWVCIYGVNWDGAGGLPSPAYSISVLLVTTLLCFSLSAYIFCKRDVNVRQGGILQ